MDLKIIVKKSKKKINNIKMMKYLLIKRRKLFLKLKIQKMVTKYFKNYIKFLISYNVRNKISEKSFNKNK